MWIALLRTWLCENEREALFQNDESASVTVKQQR